MNLAAILYSQGFGSRRECAALVADGRVEVEGLGVVDDARELAPSELRFRVGGGTFWPYRAVALLVLNKPAGYECSLAPRLHPSVYSLLPEPLRRRGVQAVGRLDVDTTGVLLFTDDGALLHRLTSPRHDTAKVYRVSCKHVPSAEQIERLLSGVVLRDDPRPVRARACTVLAERSLSLTLGEGKYHQVKRMLAAVGNRVEALHRSSFAGVGCDELAAGEWRWLDAV